jgi:uncharacterized protein DUF3298/peptidoglycan-N-acetylmuramic acid deacetylase PdaC-like protein
MRTRIQLTLLLAITIVAAGACRKTATTQNTNSAATPAADVVGGGAAQSGEKFSFRGAIANLSIEMSLLRDGERLTGTYFYPRIGKNIALQGGVDSGGNVDLRESDETGKETGVFKGKWKSNDTGFAEIEGKWSRPDGSKETDFSVTQQPLEFTADVRVMPKVIRENNKDAKYTVEAEYPQLEGDVRFDKFNAAARGLITKDVAAFKTAETASADEELDVPAETQTSSLNIGYEIRFATDDLISVEFTEGSYSRGAAHGNSVTEVLNYDVKNSKRLALADLFNPKSNYLDVISTYCMKDLRAQAQRQKDSMLLEDQIESGAGPNADNYRAWTITRKGLWITFDPYQVAAYAAGPQHVLVPYSTLKSIIKPDGPIGNLAG